LTHSFGEVVGKKDRDEEEDGGEEQGWNPNLNQRWKHETWGQAHSSNEGAAGRCSGLLQRYLATLAKNALSNDTSS